MTFTSANDLVTFFGQERLVGGMRAPFSTDVSSLLSTRFSFPCSGIEAAERYRECANKEFGSVLCDIDRQHAAFAELSELDIEEHGVRTAGDVFVALAIVLDAGDQASSYASQAARVFARKVPTSVPAWAVVLGWRIVAKRLGEGKREGNLPVSIGGLADIICCSLPPLDVDLARLPLDGDIGDVATTVIQAWDELLRSVRAFRSHSASTTYACMTHQHYPKLPAQPYHCLDKQCGIHHIGQHAKDMYNRSSSLMIQLQRELEILSQP